MEQKLYIVVKAWKGILEEVLVFKQEDAAYESYERMKSCYNPETDEVCIYSWPVQNRCPETSLEVRMI